MSAVIESAFADIFVHFTETACKLLFADNVIAVRVERGETGGISDISALTELIEFSGTSSMPASAEFFAYFCGRDIQRRIDGIQES